MRRGGLNALYLMLVVAIALLSACSRGEEKARGGELQVVATLFPIYDFARQVGGDKVEVRLLLPPGMEAHSFEPRPEDILRMNRADLFLYTNKYMEPWGAKLLAGISNKRLLVVEAGAGASLLPAGDAEPGEGHAGHGHGEGMDPHIWLDVDNARKMVDNIADGFARQDPANREVYLRNAAAYKAKLAALDERFRSRLSNCSTRMFMHGGHFAFGYLAKRYGLTYFSAYAISANAEPSPKKVMELVNRIREHNLRAIFYEELISPAMAETISRETGAELVKVHGIHNVSRDEMDRGVTYLSLMEQNLESLAKGLQCR
ncbi:metal ABC transporter solute-binding protein, Zn/Mn family [Geobacter sp. DSM 9736]|uniref:metal ABC transporter solute-binding protein, Zn/Mn family n=1 Tax=Geobacter sp. DSM 9736 TaxID=1277350 RepID=UPI000B4FF3C9|nr:zinc ABC transporter substrate-binding protein [Geobacter sp. DSM 9736]SNB46960.1 zinc transport system substrate-binding protein [Geobacter sp. DSM 9736]